MPRGKRVIVSVINDLVSDQRVHRTCITLHEQGYNVLLVGRKLPGSAALNRPYKTKRMRLLFKKGAKFYAEYNFRLFLLLLFKRFDVLHSNDLDTLLANYRAWKLKGGELVYDTHEYFTEVPELVNRPKVKAFWEKIERKIFPKLKHVYTVNQSIADIYSKQYGKSVGVVRNVPLLKKNVAEPASRADFGITDDKKIILVQGAGINVDRGIEEMTQAMEWIDKAVFLVVGSGDVLPQLKALVQEKKQLERKVIFTGRVPFEQLQSITKIADVGVTLDKDTNLNYRYSLPNKLFDYLHAGLPVIASNLVEVRKVVEAYEVGIVLESHDPKVMAQQINALLEDDNQLTILKNNCQKSVLSLNWDQEKKVLLDIYSRIYS